jgi:capsule polysaccharide export protein KpsE/RkpR
MRLSSELRALRGELARMESSQGGNPGSAVDMPVGKIPEAAIDYVRARRELKLQETLLEGILRQYELAKLDEAKEGSALQQVDKALPPDYKSKPSRALIVLVGLLLGLLGSSAWVVIRRYSALLREEDPARAEAWQNLKRSWRLRR